MDRFLARLLLTSVFFAGLVQSTEAADIAFERPAARVPGATALLQELTDTKSKLNPRSFQWLEEGQPVPSGFWGLTEWDISDDGSKLQLKAKFTRPGSPSTKPIKVATCSGRINDDLSLSRRLVESCIHDLLNQTFFDPQEGFVGFVEAPICEHDSDNDYRFTNLRLKAVNREPGLTRIATKQWRTIQLAMKSALDPRRPYLFSDLRASAEEPFGNLKTLGPEDSLLRLDNAAAGADNWIDYLDDTECRGNAVPRRTLRFYLEHTKPVDSTFSPLGRTTPSGGGG
jgi:hypothetical protein